MTREDWKWAVAMVLCGFVMLGVGYVAGHRTGTVEAETRRPVRPEDFAADAIWCVQVEARARCFKGGRLLLDVPLGPSAHVPEDCAAASGKPVRCDMGLEHGSPGYASPSEAVDDALHLTPYYAP